ncbi:MAG: LysR family transcriptional regulator [Syntrophomonas sp.]
MNIEQFQVFRTIAQARSFTKAAKILNFTQPAISSQIKILEQTFNTSLCERGNNGVTLTEAGNIFYEYGDKILALYSELEREIARVTGEEKEFINIGASNSAGNYSLPCSILTFKEMYPNVRFKLDIGPTVDILQKIRERQLDIGVVEGELTDLDDFEVNKIDTNKLVLIAPPKGKWLETDSITISELTKEPFIAREEQSSIRHFVDGYLKTSGFSFKDFNIVMEITNFDAIKFAVMRSRGVSLVPYPVVQRELREGSLKQINVTNLHLDWDMRVICRANESLTGLKEAFLKFITVPGVRSFKK